MLPKGQELRMKIRDGEMKRRYTVIVETKATWTILLEVRRCSVQTAVAK